MADSAKQPATFKDLYLDLMNRAREETGLAATKDQAKRYINIALHDMHIGQSEKFPWAEHQGVLVTQPQYTTGTISTSQGSLNIVGVGTLWDTNNGLVKNMRPGGKIKINGSEDVYEVGEVNSDTTANLQNAFVDADVSGVSYVYFEDEYELAPDFLRPIDQQKFDEGISIDLVGRTEFRRRYPRNSLPGKPRVGTIVDSNTIKPTTGTITSTVGGFSGVPDSTTGCVSAVHGLNEGDTVVVTGTSNYDGTYQISRTSVNSFDINKPFGLSETGTWTRTLARSRKLVLHPPPNTAEIIRYHYVTSDLATGIREDLNTSGSGQNFATRKEQLEYDSDEPIVPLRYRHAIVFHALSHWYRDKKDDQRSQAASAEYVNLMTRIIGDTEIGGARAQLRPRIGRYKSRAKRPWGGSTGRYDVNGAFDRFER